MQYRGDGSGIVEDTRMPGYLQALGSSDINPCPAEWGNGTEVCFDMLDTNLWRARSANTHGRACCNSCCYCCCSAL
jgi:hypothetical protein